jgi:thioredoxin-related protein
MGNTPWYTDMDKAKHDADQSHKLILLNFSGSDWCVPCIRMHKEIFESEVFEKYASDNLVLVNADFPRLRKNHLSSEQTKKNELLADAYNPKGSFPLTLLMDAKGKVLKQWEGMPDETADKFVNDIDVYYHSVALNVPQTSNIKPQTIK